MEIINHNNKYYIKTDTGYQPIISSTDESLKILSHFKSNPNNTGSNAIMKSLPRPSNDFLKKYCELGGIDEVLVEYELVEVRGNGIDLGEKDYYKLKVAPDNTITIKPFKDSWSREEVILLLDKFVQDLNQRKSGHTIEFKENWIKENL